MDPPPDFGYDSYKGSGKLKDKVRAYLCLRLLLPFRHLIHLIPPQPTDLHRCRWPLSLVGTLALGKPLLWHMQEKVQMLPLHTWMSIKMQKLPRESLRLQARKHCCCLVTSELKHNASEHTLKVLYMVPFAMLLCFSCHT